MPLAPVTNVRIDKWLWAARLYKTRGVATDACRKGWVEVGGQSVKPAREVRVGDVIAARVGVMTRTVRVLALVNQRVGAGLVGELAEDLTPPSEYEKRPERTLAPPVIRPPGAGRPTKRDRRSLKEALGFED
jgi:ribosome-associated heat shock protein Hsp15